MLEALKVFLLGITEGITEWLPISSTGHLLLLEEFVKLNVSDAFRSMFNVVIQLGAIMAVVVIYFRRLNPFSPSKSEKQKLFTIRLWVKIIIACIPAAVIGFLFDDYIDEHFMNYIVVAFMLIIYGFAFLLVEKMREHKAAQVKRLSELTTRMALIIGCFQALSLIPGTSRSGATIIGGLLLGASRGIAAEFTFFLGVPIMFGAGFLKIIKFGFRFQAAEIFLLLLGCFVSFAVSVFAIRFLMRYIKTHDFKAFGYYRIVLGIIILLYFGLTIAFA